MAFSVVTSKDNIAGMNIVSFLSKEIPLHILSGHICFLDKANEIDAEPLVFASTHKSVAGKPTLTVHSIGNLGKAELGGKDKTLVPASAVLNKTLIVNLQKEALLNGIDWPIVAEVDHHGPYLTKPTVFIEIGSTETEWRDKTAGKVVANTIANSINPKPGYPIAIGIGGPHYCPNFSKVLFKTDIALSHIAPKHALEVLDFDLFKQMIDKTVEPVDFVLIDWKGAKGSQRNKIISYCDNLGLDYKRVKDVL